jgi:predicted DNA-binding transcriptional regulator AlpA|tara:strand:+ start:383 stop:598 length:216 start_codon:yes stop_codon:yes gene_type:complete
MEIKMTKDKKMKPKVLRMRQIIEYTNLSKSYIYQKIAEGTFPEGRLLSAGIRVFDTNQVDDFLDKRTGKKG